MTIGSDSFVMKCFNLTGTLEVFLLFFTLSAVRRSHLLLLLRPFVIHGFALTPLTNLHHLLIYSLSFSVQSSWLVCFHLFVWFIMGFFY